MHLNALKGVVKEAINAITVGDFNWSANRLGIWEPVFLEWLHLNTMHRHIRVNTKYRSSHVPSPRNLAIASQINEITELQCVSPLCKSCLVALEVTFCWFQSRVAAK